MTDIVERLRDGPVPIRVCNDAADEIDRLNKQASDLAAIIRQQGFEIERLNGVVDSWVDINNAAGVTLRAQEAEVERLRAALRGALSMVDSFASGAGFSTSGRAEYENCRAALETKP